MLWLACLAAAALCLAPPADALRRGSADALSWRDAGAARDMYTSPLFRKSLELGELPAVGGEQLVDRTPVHQRRDGVE